MKNARRGDLPSSFPAQTTVSTNRFKEMERHSGLKDREAGENVCRTQEQGRVESAKG